MITEPIYEAFVEQSRKLGVFGTGHTYGGHPVSAAVALETLKIYEDDDIIGHVRRVSPRFLERLAGLSGLPLIGEARGVGLIAGLEIVADKATKGAVSAPGQGRGQDSGSGIRARLDRARGTGRCRGHLSASDHHRAGDRRALRPHGGRDRGSRRVALIRLGNLDFR